MALSPLEKSGIQGPKGPVFVIVLDGIGVGRGDESDAIKLARTPIFDFLDENTLKTTLFAHGTHVGMPSDADMGNSEVGHNAIGAGRVFSQGARLVEEAVQNKTLFQSETWNWLIKPVVENDKTLHFIGLLSDGNVHSHIEHLFAMIREADKAGVRSLCIHPLMDGRDVGSTTALNYVQPLENLLQEINQNSARDYRIASGGGRMFVTMDRYEADWSIVERGWHAHVLGEARAFQTCTEAIETFRNEHENISDQVLPPFIITRDGKPAGTIEDGDSVIMFNFRGDRAIEISKAFELDEFHAFDRIRRPKVQYAGMMQYDGDTHLPEHFLVQPPAIDRTLGEYLATTKLRQLACAETQKFGHVTYFWNGNRSGYFDQNFERYIEVPSDRVDFSERPWMKAAEVTDAVIEALNTEKFDFVRINYANGDMVGHTGNREATIIAVEAVNLALGRLLEKIKELNGIALITADHGNADEMYQWNKKKNDFLRDENNNPVPLTSHTLNKVPLWFYDPSHAVDAQWDENVATRRLSNIAATALFLMGYKIPDGYEPSLLKLK